MKLRRAALDEVPALLALAEAEPLSAQWTAAHYQARINDADGIVMVALEGATVVGCVAGRAIAPECEIENIVVAGRSRRSGVGKEMLRALIDDAATQHGCGFFWLEVRESNAAARRFYESCGFTEAARRRGYYAGPEEDALVMKFSR